MKTNIGHIDPAIIENVSIGNDLVFLPNFKESFNELFKAKVYTPAEIDYCDQFEDALLRYASTWAAKEAVYKAVKQMNPAALPFKNIEIIRNKIAGKPTVSILNQDNQPLISLSISHDGEYVWAVAILRSSLAC
ncbi:holo-ACP synthase [Pedobacter sp. MW01-1-1]|uniref:holo-ACP synthase n=1 Tax=Pedobacter sp. MW01-1-1 TaxID=3383027 RepID=UPI003FF056AE